MASVPLTPQQVESVLAYLSHTLRLGIDTYREITRVTPALANGQLPPSEEQMVMQQMHQTCVETGGDLCTATRLVDELIHHRRISEADASRMRLPQPLLRALGESMASLAATSVAQDVGALPLVDMARVENAASSPDLSRFLDAYAVAAA